MSSSSRLQDKPNGVLIDHNNNSNSNTNKTKLNLGLEDGMMISTGAKLIKSNCDDVVNGQEFSSNKMKIRVVKLRQTEANSKLGFSLRGGKESTGSSVGVFVSHVEPNTEADRKGLKIGDQLLQVNGLNVDQSTYEMVIHLIKQTPKCNDICLKVNNLGRIPFQEMNGDPIKWLLVSDLLPPSGQLNKQVKQEQFITLGHQDHDDDDDHHHHRRNRKGVAGSNGGGSSNSSCDEGLESYNGSQRLANSLSTCELSESEQQQQQNRKPANNNKNAPSRGQIVQKAKGTNYQHCEHDSAISSSTITTANSSSLDTQSTCSSASSSSSSSSSTHTIESSACILSPSSSACSISISSIHSSSATSTGSGSADCSEYERPVAASSQQELKETLVRVPGGKRTSETFGCGVVKGPDEWPGIYVQSVKPGSLAERVGLKAGDQLTRADGQALNQLTFDAAISLIKGLQQQQNELKLYIKKGAALRYLAEQQQHNVSLQQQSRGCQRQPEVSTESAPPQRLLKEEDQPKPVIRSRKSVTTAAESREQNDKIYGVATDRSSQRLDDVSVVELHKWRQAKVESEALKRRQQLSGIQIEQKQLAANVARKQLDSKQIELSPKQHRQEDPKGARVVEPRAIPVEGDEEEKKEQVVVIRRGENGVDQDSDSEDNGRRRSNCGGSSSQEEEEIRIVSQNCKLHYSHQSMQNYKQHLVMEKFKQRPMTQQTDDESDRPKQPIRPEPTKAKRRAGQQQQQQQVVVPEQVDACVKRRRQLLIDERMSRYSQAPGRQQPAATTATPAAAAVVVSGGGGGLQRYVSMDCLSVCDSIRHQQQRRFRSSSATRHHNGKQQQHHPMASSDRLQLDPRQQQHRVSHQRSSSVLGQRIQKQVALGCCNPFNDDLGTRLCLASSKDCSRTMAASRSQCCKLHPPSLHYNNMESGRFSTLDSPLPPHGLSRSKAHSMDKLNMNINLNYVKIGLANSYRALHASSPRLIQNHHHHQMPPNTTPAQQSHHLQNYYNQRQRNRNLLPPCSSEEICCSRYACPPILQQQQQQRRLQQCNYTTGGQLAAGSRGGKIRQQVVGAPSACCRLVDPSTSVAAGPYCTALSKHQLRKDLMASCQTLSHHQTQQQHQRVALGACCHSGYSCQVYCARPTVDRQQQQQLCRATTAKSTRVAANDTVMVRQVRDNDPYDMSVDYHCHPSRSDHMMSLYPAEEQARLPLHRRQQQQQQQQVRCHRASHLKMMPTPHARSAPIPPPLPPMSRGEITIDSYDNPSAKQSFQSPRDTRQRLSTFLSNKTTSTSGRSCSSNSTMGTGHSTIVICGGDGSSPSVRQESSSSINSMDSRGEQPPAAILLSHRQCRSSPAPNPPKLRADQVAVPCPPPPPAPDAEFDYKVSSMVRVGFERISSSNGRRQLQQISESKQPPRFTEQPEVADQAKKVNPKVGISKQQQQNRLCFVDELKMLADRQQQQELAQQKQLSAATGGQSKVNSTTGEPSATLIKIINASKTAHRAAAATTGSCGCTQNCASCSETATLGGGSCCNSRTEATRCAPTSHRCLAKPHPESKASVKLQDQDSKRRQHEMLMKEFKSAHSKMFSKRRNANLEEVETTQQEHEHDGAKDSSDKQNKEQQPRVKEAMPTVSRDQPIKNSATTNGYHQPGKQVEPPSRETEASGSSPEVVATKRATIKTINTKKIQLIVQSNPLHVAAAN